MSKESLMRCPLCGNTSLRPMARFCPRCGTPLSQKDGVALSDRANAPTTRFAVPQSPSAMPAIAGQCMFCGSPVAPDTLWCAACHAVKHQSATVQRLDQPLVPGSVIQQRYRIRSVLRVGMLSAVYLADDTRVPGQQVLIKVNRGQSPEAFEAAAQQLIAFPHPHVPQVLAYVLDVPAIQAVIVDWCSGESLHTHVVREHMLAERRALTLLYPLFQAVAHLHNLGIVHRDITPDTIVVRPDDHILLMDFGSIKARGFVSDRLVSEGFSPIEYYRAGGTARPGSDVYALGACLYYTLTGRIPPSAFHRELGTTLVPPRHIVPTVSVQTERVIHRAMQMNMNHRYRCVQDVMNELYS